MEANSNKDNSSNKTERRKHKKPYYKKRYNPKPSKKKFWNADKIVSLSAMAIALFTLVVLLYQSHILDKQYELTVKQQKAAVLPYLQFIDESGDDVFSINIKNKGLGPAFIKGLYIKEKDSTFLHFNLKMFYDNKNTDTVYSWNSASIIEGIVLSPGETMELFSARGGSSGLGPIKEFFYNYFSMNNNMFFIEYESVFGDAWISTTFLQNMTKEEYGDFEVYYDLVE
ncbi:hypothetical protein [Marivirga harenae]|uniref:hypothetical protein n=1 Tax=Marivirga harenae TaxID=2010992 RepID=UPI0026DF2129|nr:hypothetical protein [Marivirga harenae]WKV13248.1 hypothetical protein Q3Y49_05330 [Marivirga harenae]